jgi:hypothetical protein
MVKRSIKITLGALIWISLVAAGAKLLLSEGGGTARAVSLLAAYLTQKGSCFILKLPEPVLLEVGDEVRLSGTPGDSSEEGPVGEIEALLDDEGSPIPDLYAWCRSARARIFDRRTLQLRRDASCRLVRVPQSAAWIAQTLLTSENVRKIAEEWNATMLEHREEIFRLLTPPVRDLILDLEKHLESELPLFLRGHPTEVGEIVEGLRGEFLREKFPEFFVKELWPAAQPRLAPVIQDISREIWDRFPLWGLSWRLAYQALPFTSNDHVEKAWGRFLDDQVIPILKAHSDEVLAATREIAREVLSRGEIVTHLRQAFEGLVESPKFHALSQVFLREVFLDNPRFHETLQRRWESPEVQRVVQVVSSSMEPMVRRMGDVILGTRKDGITREFTRVLRAEILLKDLQHLIVHPGAPGEPPLAEGASLEATIEWDIKG